MHIGYRIKYVLHKALLTYFGPAQLSRQDDPLVRLEQQRDRVLGPRKPKNPPKPHVRKRRFTDTPQSR